MGEVTVPEDTQRMLFQYFTYTKFNTEELYPREAGMGWSNLPEHAFTLVHNTKQGLYLSSMDHKLDEYIRCIYETLPDGDYAAQAGAATSKRGNGERNLMRTQIKAARMLYLQPGESRNLVPVIMTPYAGTWHKGADIYKAWRKTWFVEPHRAAWLDEVNTWQQLQINSSESRINFKIKDLPKYVDEAKRYGVNAIQLTGWSYGGQDRGLPNFSIDPRPGTTEEFRKVIADAQEEGGEYPALHQIHVGRPDDRIPREVPAAPCDQCVARSLCASGVQLQHLYAVDRRQYAPLQHPLHDGR